jgi:hypothetical protein
MGGKGEAKLPMSSFVAGKSDVRKNAYGWTDGCMISGPTLVVHDAEIARDKFVVERRRVGNVDTLSLLQTRQEH